MRLIIFDDAKGPLAPLTDLRPAFDVRCGPLTNLDRLAVQLARSPDALFVPEPLADLARDTHDLPINRFPPGDGPVLLVNGRCPLLPASIDASLPVGTRIVEPGSGDTIAAVLDDADARRFADGQEPASPPADPPVEASIEADQPLLLSRPWHVRSARDAAIAFDLAHFLERPAGPVPPHAERLGEHPVWIHPTATLHPRVTLNTESGPIVVAAGATIRAGATILGPAFIGPRSTVIEHAVIRPNTSIGPVCKVGGEVGGTVFQGYSNKAHDGYLGDSWVGEWVNLGAATVNSNLLNTYAEIVCQAEPGGKREKTGETFLGAIIGDHVKTSIGTRLMTGCILHTGSMFAQTAPVSGCIARFTWATGAEPKPYRIGKFIEVAQAVMGRRDIEPSEAYLARLRQLAAE